MRKIKFRALAVVNDKHNGIKVGDFVYGHYIESGVDAPCIIFGDGEQIQVDRKTLGQFIGRTDKDGAEVYDGDIFDIHQTVNGCNIFIVEWNKLGWSVKYGFNMITPRFYEYDVSSLFEPCKFTGEVDFEVIGNIHQNLELLEQ